ncbi:hypothetical protein [Nocardioides sp. LHG3406-4]|uniref:hypothetical protein n=1 Tax=Nocardioides sp. LHG3406-4 TaxID=2804575 RepID=UPI003CF141DA
MNSIPGPVPTQVRNPLRTALRTAVQVGIPALLALGLVVPQIVDIILEESGESLPGSVRAVLLATAGIVTAIAAILARIMAIPQVEVLLRTSKLLSGFAAAPIPPALRGERGASDVRLSFGVVVLLAIAVLALALLTFALIGA